MMNHICDGELERGQFNDFRKKSLKKGGIKVVGGLGYTEHSRDIHVSLTKMWKINLFCFPIVDCSLSVLGALGGCQVLRGSAEFLK